MSDYRVQVKEEVQVYEDFQAAVKDQKRKAPHNSVYSISFYLQVWALMQRQFILKWQDGFSLVVSWVTSIVVAIFLGTVWLQLLQTSTGGSHAGVSCLLVL